MTKKHFSILHIFTTLVILLCGCLCANANPLFTSSAETVLLPKSSKAVLSKEAIQEAKRNLAGELFADELYGHPNEYFVLLQRMQQHNLQPQEVAAAHLYENIFAPAADISSHSYATQNTVVTQPYYYAFLFRLTPF